MAAPSRRDIRDRTLLTSDSSDSNSDTDEIEKEKLREAAIGQFYFLQMSLNP